MTNLKFELPNDNCVFCNEPIPTIWDKNNPYPVSETGWCCKSCNASIVIPARLINVTRRTTKGDTK